MLLLHRRSPSRRRSLRKTKSRSRTRAGSSTPFLEGEDNAGRVEEEQDIPLVLEGTYKGRGRRAVPHGLK